MGLTIWEQGLARIPAITHPKIFYVQENYRAGIVAQRNLESYRQAIIELMENSVLHHRLAQGALEYAKGLYLKTFSDYQEILSTLKL